MRRLAVLPVCLLLILIAGCSSAEQIQVKMKTPNTFTPGQPFAIQFRIADSNGTPIKGAKVSADLNMKEMDHGTVPVSIQEIGNGLYIGQTVLEMNGDWVADVKVVHDGKSFEEEKTFSIDVQTKENAHKVTGHVTLPDFKLIDQNRKQVTKQDLIGKTVVMTFTYTNCIDPNACPVLLGNLNKLQQDIKAKQFPIDKIILVSVSLDPENDTPEVLKKHAQDMNFNQSYLRMLTGSLPEINKLASALGEHFEKKGKEIIHDNKTFIFNQNGTLTHEFTGSYIDQQELFQVVTSEQ